MTKANYKKMFAPLLLLALLIMGSCEKKAKVSFNFPERFEGQQVELMNYLDSTVICSSTITDGKAEFVLHNSDSLQMPVFVSVQVDGRIRAFYIAEPGTATMADSLSVPTGTPLNDKFSNILFELDSLENLDDMVAYTAFVEKSYNENRDNPIGDYMGVECLKYMEPASVDSLLNLASPRFRNSRRVAYYANSARKRALTAPGMPYVDFTAENQWGGPLALSSLVKPGQYTLLDFWASWCPYCIKELPELKALYDDYKNHGLEIVGVAVRDMVKDTKQMVKQKEIKWPIMYNAQRIPYEIYGFSGIPHHLLIGPDGTIISRGENVEQLRNRLENLLTAE